MPPNLNRPGPVTTVLPLTATDLVALDAIATIQFATPLNPLTVGDDGFRIQRSGNGPFVEAQLTLDMGEMRVRITPNQLLQPDTSYSVAASDAVRDIFGNSFFLHTQFETGNTLGDTTPAVVEDVSPMDGAADVPVNVLIQVLLSRGLDQNTVAHSTISLRSSSGEVALNPIQSQSISPLPRSLLLIEPAVALDRDSIYTLSIDGVRDLSGNTLPFFTSNFRTSVLGASDGSSPRIISTNPVDAATDVSLMPTISMEFSEPLTPFSVETSNVTLVGFPSIPVTKELSPDGRTVTITPQNLLVPQRQYSLWVSGFRDLAGNFVNLSSHRPLLTFKTGDFEGVDNTRPFVVSVSPPDGAPAVVGIDTVLTFSEPVLPDSLNNNVALILDGNVRARTAATSLDNTVVFMNFGDIPIHESEVAVVVNRGSNGFCRQPGYPLRKPLHHDRQPGSTSADPTLLCLYTSGEWSERRVAGKTYLPFLPPSA